jgi:hypothetical protein
MKQAAPRCEKMLKAACVDVFDPMSCEAAEAFCANEISAPFFSTGTRLASHSLERADGRVGLNPYDISRECEGGLENTLCYPITAYVFRATTITRVC